VNIVGDHPADFVLYEDDGVTLDYGKGKQNQIRLHSDGAGHSAERAGNYRGPARFNIAGWKQF
jgi:hypothetical protein